MSNIGNKSQISQEAAKVLHDKYLYSSVAHCSYYSCFQLLKHIWIYTLGKTPQELEIECGFTHLGSHEFLINEIGSFIKNSGKKDCVNHFRIVRTNLWQLKKLRVDADYNDSIFDSSKSKNSIYLSEEIIPILKKY